MKQEVPKSAVEHRETLWRTLQTFNLTRIVIAVVLLIYLSINQKKEFWADEAALYRQICFGYLALAAAFAALAVYWRRRFGLHLISQVVLDIGVISLLYVAAGGAKSGLAILYLFPLAGAAILVALPLALFFVSIVVLILLGESGYQLLQSSADGSTLQAGLYGAAFFAAVFVVNRLAARLIKQESLAAQRGQDLQVQQAINQLVIADMGDGILVVSADGTIFTANPAAESMLGLAVAAGQPRVGLKEIPTLKPLAKAFAVWRSRSEKTDLKRTEVPVFVVIKPGNDPTLQGATTVWGRRRELSVHLKLRFVRVETSGASELRTVIFLQDVTEIENQAQQLKLASMGRLTASIAHEVRNPLSAIAHAATLLEEDASDMGQRRLLRIVGDNVGRLNQMIEDILKLSRKAQQHGEPIALAPMLGQILEEFCATHTVRPIMMDADMGSASQVWFDPLHLREVLVNLLGNALRYASGGAGSIRVHTVMNTAGHLELHVQDDGPVITPEIRAHLFEPFYTTSSKGTGLGLYLARELCLNNGAMLDYEYRIDDHGGHSENESGRFVITFAASASA